MSSLTLHVDRGAVVEAALPVHGEAEKADVELAGLGDVEDSQDRDRLQHLLGHRARRSVVFGATSSKTG